MGGASISFAGAAYRAGRSWARRQITVPTQEFAQVVAAMGPEASEQRSPQRQLCSAALAVANARAQ